MERFAWLAPTTLTDAAVAATMTVAEAMTRPQGTANPGMRILKAGGIDVLDLLKEGLLTPEALVNLASIPGLDEIHAEGDAHIRIGALVTLSKLASHPLIQARYAALAAAAGGSASPQIRNVATLGGNLLQRPRCWYFRSEAYHCLRKGGEHCYAHLGDHRYHAVFNNHPCAIVHPSSAAVALVALGAEVELWHPRAGIRRIGLEQFLSPEPVSFTRENDLRPHEILTQVRLPALGEGVRSAYVRVGERAAFDWPLADVAAVLDLTPGNLCQRAAVVLGAAAPAPYRALAAEQALANRIIDEDSAASAARAALAATTPLAGNAYKLPLLEVLVRRAILGAAVPLAPEHTSRG